MDSPCEIYFTEREISMSCVNQKYGCGYFLARNHTSHKAAARKNIIFNTGKK
jgi:hypothetical protein